LFLEIVREYQDAAQGYAVGLRGLMLQLLTHLVREILRKDPPEAVRAKFAPALRALAEQPERLFTSTELASMCGYHPTYFAHVFRQATGVTPRHFQIRQRLERAKHLLATRTSVETVAEQLGYATVHYFSRQFKAYTGLTPTEFRQSSHEL
jgi:AraC-like DNA-binding protein